MAQTVKASACNEGRAGFDPWVRKIPWRRKWYPTPVLLPGIFHEWRSLLGYTVHGVAKSQTWLNDFTFFFEHFSVNESSCSVAKSCLTLCDQAPLSFSISHSLLKFMSIELVILTISSSAALFFCLQSFPASGSFPMSQLCESGDQSVGASASILPKNIQDWFPLGLIGLISLRSKGPSNLLQSHNLKASILWYSAFRWLGASLVAQRLKCLPAVRETWVRSLGQEDPLEKEMATHSSILAWRIPWTEEPGGLQSMGSQRAGHDWATSLQMVIKKYFCDISPCDIWH